MPEAPEILASSLKLRRVISLLGEITQITIHGNRSLKLQREVGKVFKPPMKIIDVFSKGKFIVWKIRRGGRISYIGQSSGLSGIWEVYTAAQFSKVVNAAAFINKVPIISLSSKKYILLYCDQRHFSKFKIMSAENVNKKLKKIGADIISDKMNEELAAAIKLKYSKLSIAAALMKQDIVAGIGNKLKSEILYRCNIYPGKKVKDLSKAAIFNILVSAAKLSRIYFRVQMENYGNRLYDIDNEQYTFIYGKDIAKDGREVQRAVFEDGRTTYYVK